jgi:hypothetical protein
MVPEVSRLPVDILSQILYYKTIDVGKIYGLLSQPYLVKIPTGY